MSADLGLMMDEGWHRLCLLVEIPEPVDGGFYATVGRRSLAVFRLDENVVRVIDDACPHAGASLAGGFVEAGCVVCRYHAWAFDLESGRCPDNAGIGVKVYESRVRDGAVWARVD